MPRARPDRTNPVRSSSARAEGRRGPARRRRRRPPSAPQAPLRDCAVAAGEKRRRLHGLGLLLVQHRAFGHTDAIVFSCDLAPAPGLDICRMLRRGRFARLCSGYCGRRALRYTQLRFDRADSALHDLEAPACAKCHEEADRSEKNKDNASQCQQYPKLVVHRSIPTKSKNI